MTKAQFEDAITAAEDAANDAFASTCDETAKARDRHGRPNLAEATGAAAKAYADHLPILADRRAAQLFIALIVRGVAKGWIEPKTARQHLYSAQLALSAFSMLGVSADPTPTDPQKASPGWYGARKASR